MRSRDAVHRRAERVAASRLTVLSAAVLAGWLASVAPAAVLVCLALCGAVWLLRPSPRVAAMRDDREGGVPTRDLREPQRRATDEQPTGRLPRVPGRGVGR